MKNKEINQGSIEELRAADARERRDRLDSPADMSVVHRLGFRNALIDAMEEYDPNGQRAHEIAAKYRR